MEEAKSFYNYLKKTVTILQKNKNIIFNSKQRNRLKKFVTTELSIFKTEINEKKELELNMKISSYCLLFIATIQYMDFINENDSITIESIENGITNNYDKDMHILLNKNLPFNKVWTRLNTEDKLLFVDYYNNMYINALLININLSKRKKINEDMYLNLEPKVTKYSSVIKGSGEIIKYVVRDNINQNKKINKRSKKESKKSTNIVVDDVIGNMEKNGIKDSKNITMESLLFDDKFKSTIKNTSKSLGQKVNNGSIKKDNLVDMMSSIFSSMADKKSFDSDPKMKVLMNTLAFNLKKKASKQAKSDPASRRMINNIIDNFYDPNAKIDNKLLGKAMKKMGKQKKVFVRK
jgi:hypothetical protein